MLCVLSLKLLSLWLAAVVLLDGWCMFSAHRAGSGAGDVGPGPSPISHLSETMRALLDTPPAQEAPAAYFSHSEPGGGVWEEPRHDLGNARVCRLPCPLLLLLSHLLHPRVHFSLFLEIKKQTMSTVALS